MKNEVTINFSRHARRRAKLYNIPLSLVYETLELLKFKQGKGEILTIVKGYKFPIKIVIDVEGNIVTVISTYPYKKGRKR